MKQGFAMIVFTLQPQPNGSAGGAERSAKEVPQTAD